MAVSSVTSSTATGLAGATATGSNATLAQNFQTFLGLLTTQLKNQSPLDPLNTNEFTQQLVQFASVEQQMKSNDTLSSLLTASKVSSATSALGFVGATVTADGATSRLSGGTATWRLQAPRSVSGAVVTITDKTGSVVHTETRSFTAGEQNFQWTGRTSTGAIAADSEYTVNIAARDPTGQVVQIRTEVQGTVDSVDVTGSEPVLGIGSLTIPVSKVKTIKRSG